MFPDRSQAYLRFDFKTILYRLRHGYDDNNLLYANFVFITRWNEKHIEILRRILPTA